MRPELEYLQVLTTSWPYRVHYPIEVSEGLALIT